MTKATTAADVRATWVAWTTAVLLHLVVFGLLWQNAGTLGALPQEQVRRVVQPNHRRQPARQEQRTRVLPAEHAQLLMKQAELLIRRELYQSEERFQAIADAVLTAEKRALHRVELRPADAEFNSEVNNTLKARANNASAISPLPAEASIEAIYERLAELEQQILVNYLDARAGELALQRGQSYPEVRALLQPNAMRMIPFRELVTEQLGDDPGDNSRSAPRLEVRTIEDLNTYRRVLDRSSRESGLAESRLTSLLRQTGAGRPDAGAGSGEGQGGGGMAIGGGSGEGFGAALRGRVGSEASKDAYIATLDPEIVQAQALPDRRFSRDSSRRGWLYINTWYMIGPWYNFGRNDFAIIHPPGMSIDFDAVYTDGQRGLGIAEREADPIKVRGDEMTLDGTLRWKFMQSESMHNVPPVTIDWSTYYAYTELYFDQPAVMYVAVGTDDSGKVWINGEEIWHDRGMSWYKIDEHVQPFRFNQGVNRVLVRLENDGGGATGFSFLVCPPNVVRIGDEPGS